MLLIGFVWYQFIAMFGLSIGLHRHFAHNQFKTSKLYEVFSLFLAMLAFSRSPLSWIGAHRIHHRFSDTEKDPHSPTYKGFWNVLFNNWNVKKIDRPYVRDLYKNPRIMFFHNHWLKLHIATAVITLLISVPVFVIFVFLALSWLTHLFLLCCCIFHFLCCSLLQGMLWTELDPMVVSRWLHDG